MDSARPCEASPAWYVTWIVIGGGYALAVLTLPSIGIFLLPVVIGSTAIAVTKPRGRASTAGLISGLGIPLLYVAYLNRSGPGETCEISATETHCTEHWSPIPWVVMGLLLIAAGALLFRKQRPTRRDRALPTD